MGTGYWQMMTPWSTASSTKMDGAAGDLCTEVEGLLLAVEAGEGPGSSEGWTLRMRLGKSRYEGRRDDAHVASKADEVDFVLVKAVDHFSVVIGTFAASRGDGKGQQVD